MEELEKSKEISSGSGLIPQFNPQIKEDRLVAFLDIMGFKGPLEKVCGYRSTIKILFCPFIKLNNG